MTLFIFWIYLPTDIVQYWPIRYIGYVGVSFRVLKHFWLIDKNYNYTFIFPGSCRFYIRNSLF